ncbi:MAG TPA: hypothetical protein VFZ25_21350 [Chloroflexota bacterium]|nr:hypothetical protein [Chloroflexota bacterium]
MRIPNSPLGVGQTVPFIGHRHFWQRAMARRQLFRAGAGLTALALGAGLGGTLPTAAHASGVAPKPIPGGSQWGLLVDPDDTTVYHAYYPAFGQEVATITDFNGFVAATEVQGSGTGTDGSGGNPTTLYFDVDVRFMQGTYVGVDGMPHQGTFGFV